MVRTHRLSFVSGRTATVRAVQRFWRRWLRVRSQPRELFYDTLPKGYFPTGWGALCSSDNIRRAVQGRQGVALLTSDFPEYQDRLSGRPSWEEATGSQNGGEGVRSLDSRGPIYDWIFY